MIKVFAIGNLTKDPELRNTPNGVPVTNFTIAINRRVKDAKPDADFYRVTAWRGLAENCAKYLKKGNKCGVIGTLTLNPYEDKEGIQRTSVDIQADEVEFLTPKSETSQTREFETPNEFVPVDDSDLPF